MEHDQQWIAIFLSFRDLSLINSLPQLNDRIHHELIPDPLRKPKMKNFVSFFRQSAFPGKHLVQEPGIHCGLPPESLHRSYLFQLKMETNDLLKMRDHYYTPNVATGFEQSQAAPPVQGKQILSKLPTFLLSATIPKATPLAPYRSFAALRPCSVNVSTQSIRGIIDLQDSAYPMANNTFQHLNQYGNHNPMQDAGPGSIFPED